MNDASFLTAKEQKGYIEEIIILDKIKEILKYSLSNSLDDIRTAIYERTGFNINLNKATWKLNPSLSVSVKHLMNNHHVKYSMTTDINDDGNKYIVINMRVDNNWFVTGYGELNGMFISYHLLEAFSYFKKLLDMGNQNDDE